MSASDIPDTSRDALRQTAVQWTIRRDRGLSAQEAIEFELWLAADPRHGEAMRFADGAWSLLEHTPEAYAVRELSQLRQRRAQKRRWLLSLIPLAAALALGSFYWWENPSVSPKFSPSISESAAPQLLALADGSLVKLNTNADVYEDYDARERRVHLRRGEAHFTVKKDATRPFIVIVGDVRLRAVGTAFNVNLQSSQLEVLVTEGRVHVATESPTESPTTLLVAGERAIVTAPSNAPAQAAVRSIVVDQLDASAVNRLLAWQESLVKLRGATLSELADYFERRFDQRVILEQPELGALRAGGRIRGDHPEAFLNLLATTFELEIEQSGDGVWILRKKSSTSR
ncbi:MAG TPA: FecR domain-containing protein [Opitutaceae bacterium]|nr:FecR domain-containing protein [Opitutaceae bacterium]